MLSTIAGTTDVYLIPGDPVEQVRAPEVFNLIFQKLGINAVLVPVHVPATDIEAFVRNAFLAKNVKGMFLAIPHKSLVMGLLSHCNDYGRVAGAVLYAICNGQVSKWREFYSGDAIPGLVNFDRAG